MFDLHPQLAADCTVVGDLPLSRVLLANDSNYPWCILVPRRPGIREIYELSEADQQQLLSESSLLGRTMMTLFAGEKLNVAALGNMVPQLHLHHIVRHVGDAAWPGPIWGKVAAVAYPDAQLDERVAQLQQALGIA